MEIAPQLGPQKKSWMSNSADPIFSMGIFLVGLLWVALVYGGRIYQNTWILVCWTCVLGKNQLIHVLNDCILGKKSRTFCHLQSLIYYIITTSCHFFGGDKNTMESSSTPPNRSWDWYICIPTFTILYPYKNNQPSHVFQGKYSNHPRVFSIGYAWPGTLPRWLGLGSASAACQPWLPRNPLQVFNTGVHTMGKSCRALEWAKLG